MKLFSLSRLIEWLLISIIILLPFQTRWIAIPGELNGEPWEYGTVSLYGIDILIVLLLCIALIWVYKNNKAFHLSFSQWLAVGFGLIAFFSMTFAGNTLNALFWCTKLAEGIALFIIIPQLPFSLRTIQYAVISSALIQSIFAYVQFILQQIQGSSWWGIATQLPYTLGVQVIQHDSERILRGYGSLPHPNMLAGWLVIALLICVVLYIQHSITVKRIFYPAIMAVLSIGLWTTFSRQAWIALACAMGVLIGYLFIQKKEFPKTALVALLCILLPWLSFSIAFPELIQSRIGTQTRLEEKSIQERQEYMNESYTVLQNNWTTGVGIGNYTAYLHKQDKKVDNAKSGWEYQPVHNIYLLIFAELGIFGLLAFLLFLLSLLINLKWGWNIPERLIWSLSTIALLIIGMMDHYLWSLHFGILLFWLTLSFVEKSKQPLKSPITK